jgi:hypothetical protein
MTGLLRPTWFEITPDEVAKRKGLDPLILALTIGPRVARVYVGAGRGPLSARRDPTAV